MYTIVFTVILFDKITTFNLISVTYKLAYSLSNVTVRRGLSNGQFKPEHKLT